MIWRRSNSARQEPNVLRLWLESQGQQPQIDSSHGTASDQSHRLEYTMFIRYRATYHISSTWCQWSSPEMYIWLASLISKSLNVCLLWFQHWAGKKSQAFCAPSDFTDFIKCDLKLIETSWHPSWFIFSRCRATGLWSETDGPMVLCAMFPKLSKSKPGTWSSHHRSEVQSF